MAGSIKSNMPQQQWDSDMLQPLYVGVAQLPLSPAQESASSGYYPPLEPGHVFSSAMSLSPKAASPQKAVNMMTDDDRFIDIAGKLMEAHDVKNLKVDDAIAATFGIPGEHKVFLDALQYRLSQLPMFPEAGETSTDKLVREIGKKFERALRDMMTRMPYRSQPIPPSEARLPQSTQVDFSSSPRVQPGATFLSQATTNQSISAGLSSFQPRITPFLSQATTISSLQQHPHQQQGDPYGQLASPHMAVQSPMTHQHQQGRHPQGFPPQRHYTNYQSTGETNTKEQGAANHEQGAANQDVSNGFQHQATTPNQPINHEQMQHQQGNSQALQPMPNLHQQQTHHQVQFARPQHSQHIAPQQPTQQVSNQWGTSQPHPQAPLQSYPVAQMHQQNSAMQGLPNTMNLRSQPSMQHTVDTPYHQLVETPRMHREIHAQVYHQYRPPQIITEAQPELEIDWNIPILAKDLIIDAEVCEPAKKLLRIRDTKNKRSIALKKKAISPSSITSEPTAVASNVKRQIKGSSDSDETMEKDVAPKEKRDQDAIDIATGSIHMDPMTSAANDSTLDPTIVKPISGNYKLDIARNKSALLYNEAQTEEKNAVMRKSLMDEVDRIYQRLSMASGKDETDAYTSYLGELQVELEKWNRLTQFGTDKQSTSSNICSTNENNSELHKRLAPFEEIQGGQSFGTDKYTIDSLDHTYYSKHEDHMDDLHESGKAKQQFNRGKNKNAKQNGHQGDLKKHWRVANVIAPGNLPEGFKFEARNGDEVFIATVPQGGVSKGEIFSTAMGDIYGDDDEAPERTRTFKDMDAPPSRWRDELFDCFRYGLDHPFLCNTIFCPLIALHQVLTRIRMDGTGDRLMTIKSRTRVCSVIWLAFLFALVHALYFAYFSVAHISVTSPQDDDLPQDNDMFLIVTMPLLGMDLILLVYVLYIVTITRRQLRREYNIPELRCKGFEDCCLSVFCTCCTIGQMGRHTADYETYRAYCCSDTGLANHIEVKLPVEMDHGFEQKEGVQLT